MRLRTCPGTARGEDGRDMRRSVLLATLAIGLCFPAAVPAAALYLNGAGDILVRQDELDPGLVGQQGWKLVKSGDVFTLQLTSLVKREESTLPPSLEVPFGSGLALKLLAAFDPEYDMHDHPRQVTLHLVFDNSRGNEEVRVKKDAFVLVDDVEEEYETVRCSSGGRDDGEFNNPIVRAGESLAGTFCVDIPGRLELSRLKIRFDDGLGERRWIGLRKP